MRSGGLSIAFGCRAREDRPAELVGHYVNVIDFCEVSDEVFAGGFEPGVDGGAVAEEEGLVDGGLEFLAGEATVLADEFGERAAKLSEELELNGSFCLFGL